MTSRLHTIKVMAYTTPTGEPTCAANFKTFEVCRFLGSRKMGTVDTCHTLGVDLERKDGTGYLQPCKGCLVWGDDAAR